MRNALQHKVRTERRRVPAYWWAAAAVLLLLVAGWWLLVPGKKMETPVASDLKKSQQIAPGQEGA
ncbi:MAG: hypothetical protein J7578_16940, partial [Chitinophagaceae bacterium]|nr:hypothetical protein [Chitinophagaceae bacterium]